MASFTTGESSVFIYNGLEPDDEILLVDDVIAHGTTSVLTINELRKNGIVVMGVAVYFAKLFQPGVDEIKRQTGIEPYYVVGIEEISEKRVERLSPARF